MTKKKHLKNQKTDGNLGEDICTIYDRQWAQTLMHNTFPYL